MVHKIQFRLDEDILYFEIGGNICNHMDSIAGYVQHRMAESRTGRVLLDLRGATGRPSPAKVFTHVLKYPPMHHVDCAVIHREQSEDFLLLYVKLMRHRGHRIKLFGRVDEATAWLLGRKSLGSRQRSSLQVCCADFLRTCAQKLKMTFAPLH